MAYNRSNAGAAAAAWFKANLFGKPYVYGVLDCSKAQQLAYAAVGVVLPRTTEEQDLVNQLNDRSIPNEEGDLLFIPGDPIDANPGHVVMFFSEGSVGHTGEVYEAEETGTLIGEFPFDTDSWEFRTRPALALPAAPTPPAPPKPPAPKETEMECIAVSNGKIAGDWYVKGSKRCNVSEPQLQALLATGVTKKTLNDAELGAFAVTPWGEI